METDELVQDVNLHRSDLTKLICRVNKLLYNKEERKLKSMEASINNKVKQDAELIQQACIK